MSEVIENIEKDLLDVETRLVEEFHRIQTIESEAQFSEVGPSSKAEFQLTITKLRDVLDHSGSDAELELTTERHETLRTRMITVLELIDRKVPTRLLAEAEEETRPREASVAVGHPIGQPHMTSNNTIKDESLVGRIRGLFAGKRERPAASSDPSQSAPAPQRDTAPKEIYQAGGIYSVTRELASLASLIMQSEIVASESEPKEEPSQSSPTTQASKQGT